MMVAEGRVFGTLLGVHLGSLELGGEKPPHLHGGCRVHLNLEVLALAPVLLLNSGCASDKW